MDNNRALVKADREEGVLTIYVSGSIGGRRGLLTAIRAELRSIERTIPGLTAAEQVPVPNHPNVWVPYSHLLNLESAGKETVIPQGLIDEYSIGDLLDGIESRTDRSPARLIPDVDTSASRAPKPSSESDGAAWTFRESMFLGFFMLIAIVCIVGVYILTDVVAGETAAAGAALVALAAVVVIAFFVLRTAGRVSEKTMLTGIRSTMSRIVKGQAAGGPDKIDDSPMP
jgi:hypothetical protein